MLNRPDMRAFTDFIRLLRVDVSIYHNAKVCGDWRIRAHTLGATCFHIVTMGDCLLDIPGYLEQTSLNEGDLIIFPEELEHNMTPTNTSEGEQNHRPYYVSQEGTGLLCGEVRLFHLFRSQLLRVLPPYILIRCDDSTPWLRSLTALFVEESMQLVDKGMAATSVIIDRLSEILFVYALREYIQRQDTQGGFLALYVHPQLSKAIQAVHDAPADPWSIQSLSKIAGLSRTSFAETFKSVSGWTVNQYITWWRMQRAWEYLAQGETIAVVAEQVGYQSEAAFSRAFSKHFSVSPGQVRRGMPDASVKDISARDSIS